MARTARQVTEQQDEAPGDSAREIALHQIAEFDDILVTATRSKMAPTLRQSF